MVEMVWLIPSLHLKIHKLYTFWRIPEVHSGWGIYLQNGPTECIEDINDDIFVLVQLLSCAWLFATSWTAADRSSLSFTNTQSLLKFVSIESVMLSNHLILCRPFLEPLPFMLVVALEKRECFLLSLVIYKISGKDPDMALLNHKTIFTNPCARECRL